MLKDSGVPPAMPVGGIREHMSLSGRPLVTIAEVELLERLPPIKPEFKMPKNGAPPNRPRLRPSSASGNLQSHPVHNTGLYDNFHVHVQPRSTDSPVTVRDGISLRPKTSGPRAWGRSNAAINPPPAEKSSRRLTLTGAEGTADTEAAARRHVAQQTDQQTLLKIKVGGH